MATLATAFAELPAGAFWPFTLLLGAGSIVGFVAAFFHLQRARLMENLPTSRIRSAAQGYVELQGYTQLLPGPEIVSPLSLSRCAWWQYRIERLEPAAGGGQRQRRWRTVEAGRSDALFMVLDPTGSCVIDPHGATVHPGLTRRWRGRGRRPDRIPEKPGWLQFGEYRYSEQLLRVGDPLYALGWFQTHGQAHQHRHTEDLRERLREWKADQPALLRRFDANRDGVIDVAEWEIARRAASAEVDQEHLARSIDPDIHLLRRPADGRRYLLSIHAQDTLARRHRWTAAAALALSLLGGSAAMLLLVARDIRI